MPDEASIATAPVVPAQAEVSARAEAEAPDPMVAMKAIYDKELRSERARRGRAESALREFAGEDPGEIMAAWDYKNDLKQALLKRGVPQSVIDDAKSAATLKDLDRTWGAKIAVETENSPEFEARVQAEVAKSNRGAAASTQMASVTGQPVSSGRVLSFDEIAKIPDQARRFKEYDRTLAAQ